MKSGVCPKCRTPTVYRKADGIGEGGAARVHVRTSPVTVPSPVECYICTRCGYFEKYVSDPDKMFEVVNNWEKVG